MSSGLYEQGRGSPPDSMLAMRALREAMQDDTRFFSRYREDAERAKQFADGFAAR